jgi:heme-degrading monooxygenase HmoA
MAALDQASAWPDLERGGDAPFRVVLDMEVDQADTDRFTEAWCRSARSFRGVPGLLAQTLAADTEHPDRFVITSDWRAEQYFRDFEVSTFQDDATAPLRRLRRSSTMRTQNVRAVILKG